LVEKRETFVIKELYTDLMPKHAAYQAMEEINILGSLSSPFIVKYIDSFICGMKVNIIMEFCENGDLQTFLTKR
jgi:serine/threonine protein kinase